MFGNKKDIEMERVTVDGLSICKNLLNLPYNFRKIEWHILAIGFVLGVYGVLISYPWNKTAPYDEVNVHTSCNSEI